MSEESLQSQAYKAIRSKIIYAELEPGLRLSAVGLEREMGIGRTPIRESFVRLREQELVETRSKSGTYVSRINMESAENACFLRSVVERRVAIACCSKATEQDLLELNAILATYREDPTKSSRLFFDTDNRFHEKLYEIANRKMVWDWLNTINTHLERYRWLRSNTLELERDPIMSQHDRMLQAIKSRDTDEADYLAAAHLHLMPEESGPVVALHPDYFV